MFYNVSEIIELANSLLDKLPGSRRVMGMSDLNAQFYVLLYEGLFAELLPDAITPPSSREDEIHNVQMVIDTLSLDKLNTSMSHISGQQVISRDPTAVHNLLQVRRRAKLLKFLDGIGKHDGCVTEANQDRN
jgi:hypothetical protein